MFVNSFSSFEVGAEFRSIVSLLAVWRLSLTSFAAVNLLVLAELGGEIKFFIVFLLLFLWRRGSKIQRMSQRT